MSMELSDRSEFVGVHMRPVVKDALRDEAARRDTSVSKMLSDITEEYLSLIGYDLTEYTPPNEHEPPLPFNENAMEIKTVTGH